LGCALAHRNAFSKVLSSACKSALILEDDAIPSSNLRCVLEDLFTLQEHWDIVRFLWGEKNNRNSRLITRLPRSGVYLARHLKVPGGAYAYLINRPAAARLLELTTSIWLPIDTLLGMIWRHRLKILAVVPSPVRPDLSVPSCIDGIDSGLRWTKDLTLQGPIRLLWPLTRAYFRLCLNAMTRIYRITTLFADAALAARLHHQARNHAPPATNGTRPNPTARPRH
jgi:GR25 family glycosyltransferase involved in LPS biosynthesis